MMPCHPITALFPLIEGQAFEDLAIDIDLHGQREPIWTYMGQIIDGRNRDRAIETANRWRRRDGRPFLSPCYREWNGQGSLVAFVLSINLHRRHLTESLRGMLAARAAAMMEEEARQRQLEGLKKTKPTSSVSPDTNGETLGNSGRTREKAAQLANVSEATVARAQKVLKEAPAELVEAVDQGKVKVATAASWVGLPPAQILAKIKAEGEAAKRSNLTADVNDLAGWFGRELEKVRRRVENCGFGFARFRKQLTKLQDALADDTVDELSKIRGR